MQKSIAIFLLLCVSILSSEKFSNFTDDQVATLRRVIEAGETIYLPHVVYKNYTSLAKYIVANLKSSLGYEWAISIYPPQEVRIQFNGTFIDSKWYKNERKVGSNISYVIYPTSYRNQSQYLQLFISNPKTMLFGGGLNYYDINDIFEQIQKAAVTKGDNMLQNVVYIRKQLGSKWDITIADPSIGFNIITPVSYNQYAVIGNYGFYRWTYIIRYKINY